LWEEMEDSRTERLQQLLRKLGKAVHASVVGSDEVRSCLEELHRDGWQAVMLLEASLACGDDGPIEPETAKLRLHVEAPGVVEEPAYRIDAADARLLGSLGIAPGRHRSRSPGLPHRQAGRDDTSS
jgi:hypothetical protein